jgi:hypothetical protein
MKNAFYHFYLLAFLFACKPTKMADPWIANAPADGLAYLNPYDAGVTDMADFFTDKPDYRPYTAIEVDSRIFEPQKALDPFDENFNWQAVEESPIMVNEEDLIRESKERGEYRLENRERED